MNSYDVATDTLAMGETPIESTYGVVNMYRDEENATDVDHIEKAFSRLESEAARIIHKIDKVVDKGEVSLPRGEVNTLRKFLFLLCYRNDHRSQQFIDERFDEDTYNQIKEFQAEHGLKDTKAVWLFNMKNILDLEHWEIEDSPKVFWVDRTDYKHEQQEFQLGFFCVPEGSEFITTGAMGLFEGSPILDPIMRMKVNEMIGEPKWRPGVQPKPLMITLTRSWPLTPRLVVMLRNRLLTEEPQFLAQGARPLAHDLMRSYFYDFPRLMANITYNPVLSVATRSMMSGSQTEEAARLRREFEEENKLDGKSINSRLKDTLKFPISTLDEDQAARINVLMLEHCDGVLSFISPSSLRKSLKRYVEDRELVLRKNRDTRFKSLDTKLEAVEKQVA